MKEDKEKITDQIKTAIAQGKKWLTLEFEYAKLTMAEKLTLLAGAFVMVMISMLVVFVVLTLLSESMVDLFKMIRSPALACVTVSGILLILLLVIYLFRKPLLYNPISKFITKLFLEK